MGWMTDAPARLRDRVPAPTRRRVFWVAFAVWTALGATWALASPQFSVPDEPAHVVRAAAVAHGSLQGERVEITFDEPRPGSAVIHEFEVPRPFDDVGGRHECFAAYRGTAECAVPLAPTEGVGAGFTTAGAYQPLFYGLVGAPISVLSPVRAIYAGRLLHVLLGSVLLGAAAAAAWSQGRRAQLVTVILAVTPVVPYLLGSINPNGLEIAAAIALWVAMPLALRHGRGRDAGLAVAAALALSWSRPLSPVIALGIVVISTLLAARRGTMAALWRRGPRQLALLGVTAAILSGALWVALAGALDNFIAYPDPQLTGWTAAEASWRMSWTRLEQLVGIIGWLDTPLPDQLWWAWLGLMAGACTLAVIVGTWRQRGVVLVMVLATLLVPVLAEVLTAARMGLVWQGRYTLPIAVGAVLVPGHVIAAHLRPSRTAGWVSVAVVLVCGVGHVVTHMVAMTRYSVGYGARPWSYLANPGWTSPVPDLALLGLITATAAALTALVAWAGPPDGSDDPQAVSSGR